MTKAIIFLLICFTSLYCSPAIADNNSKKLFKTYEYGAHQSKFTEKTGYYDCAAELGIEKAICKKGILFLDEKFTIALSFDNKKLQSVMLYKDFSQDIYIKLFAALSKDFKLCAMKGVDDSVDLLNLSMNADNKSDFSAIVNNFENNNLTKGNLVYSFVETSIEQMRKYKSIPELLDNLPNSARSADLVVSEEGNEAIIAVLFTFPKTMVNKLKEQMMSPSEKF